MPETQLAAHLGITLRTLKRYRQEDKAPRTACLALFWITRWGQQTIDCSLFNELMWHRGMVEGLQRSNASLRAYVDELENPSVRQAANAAYFTPGTPQRRRNCASRAF